MGAIAYFCYGCSTGVRRTGRKAARVTRLARAIIGAYNGGSVAKWLSPEIRDWPGRKLNWLPTLISRPNNQAAYTRGVF